MEGDVLAVDIGGTKLAAALVSPEGEVRERARVPTPVDGDADALWSALLATIDAVACRTATVVGVGSGGPMTRGGELISPLNIPGWRNFPLQQRLADHTGLRVHVDNDAKALALGEGWRGAARGVRDFIAMVVSTGVGGGIVLDGRLLEGASGNAGHIGHVVVEPDGRVDERHARGVLEVEASGTALAEITGRDPQDAPPELVERTGRLVGRAVASVCNLLDMRLALVAGSVALGFGRPFFEAAQSELDSLCLLDFSRGAQVLPAGLGADGPLVGAAAVALRAEGHDIGIR